MEELRKPTTSDPRLINNNRLEVIRKEASLPCRVPNDQFIGNVLASWLSVWFSSLSFLLFLFFYLFVQLYCVRLFLTSLLSYRLLYLFRVYRGSSVGIATELRAGRSGIESRWGRDFPPVQTGPGAHPASCKMGTGSFPGIKCGRGVLLTTHPLLVPRSWKSRAIPLPTLWATPGL